MRAEAFLQEWHALVQELTGLVDEALGVDPLGGTSVAWAARLAKLSVRAMAEETRLPACRAERQTAGAPLPEVRAALEAFERVRARALSSLVSPAQRPVALEGLARLVRHAVEEVSTRATQPVKRGLFKHAKVAAARHQYGTASGPQTEVLECPSCGGPRQSEALSCVFCDAELLGGALRE